MRTFIGTMKWGKESDKWHMYVGPDFIMDFPNCKNIRKAFESLKKDSDNHYRLWVERRMVA